MEFRPIASSSAGCCYHLTGSGLPPLLLDAGIPYRKIQEALDFKVSELGGCLLTHVHGDHCKAVPDLMKAGINVYASRESWAAYPAKIALSHRAQIVDPLQQLEVAGWQVMPFGVVHDCPGTLAYLIDGGGGRGLYLTDSMYSPYRFDGLTHIFIEANFSTDIIRQNARDGSIDRERYKRTMRSHMSLDVVLDFLRANDLSKVTEIWLLHLSDANSSEEEFKSAVQKVAGKPVYIAPA